MAHVEPTAGWSRQRVLETAGFCEIDCAPAAIGGRIAGEESLVEQDEFASFDLGAMPGPARTSATHLQVSITTASGFESAHDHLKSASAHAGCVIGEIRLRNMDR